MSTIALVESKARRPSRWQEAAWDLAAAWLISLAPFSNFVSSRGYDILRLDVFLASGFLILLAAAVAAVIALRPDTLRPLIFMVLVIVLLHKENAFFLPVGLNSLLADLAGPNLVPGLSAIIYILPTTILFWLLRNKLSIVLMVAFGTMVVASVAQPQKSIESVTVVEQSPPIVQIAGDKPPPLLHLIIDQQIGVDGLPAEVAGTSELGKVLLDFYEDYGFRHYTGAYTHFPATVESVPNLLNGALVPSAQRFLALRNGRSAVKTNAWFEQLSGRGYGIEVIQSDYLDYCHGDNAPISYCNTYVAFFPREIQNLEVADWEKAKILLFWFFDKDFIKLSRTARVMWYGAQKLGRKVGLELPDWDARVLGISPISSLAALDVLAERLENLEAGKAIFAHILLPHDPYILDENCRIKSDISLWMPRISALWWYGVQSDPQRRLTRYGEYYRQVTCLHRKLAGLMDILERRGKLSEATIIIHGDHGSRISTIEPTSGNEHLITPRDIIDSVSTLFAIRGVDIAPGPVRGAYSIQALFAGLALGRNDIADHSDIFLKPSRGIDGPNQTRLPMVPFTDGD